MLKGLSNTYRNNCEDREITYNEYIVLNNTQIPVRAKLNDDCYENGNFIGSFILKTIQFETSNEYNFRNREFEYYKVVNGESIKLGTFITTEITDNDTTEIVKVTGMDYGLKTQVQYASGLDYSSGNITLMDVWNEACELSGLESGVKEFTNSNFIVDSDQFTGTGAMIRDVFKGIALSSGSFIKVMNDDKIYPIFKTHTEDLLEASINTIETLENVQEIDKISEIQGNTYQQTYTGKNLFNKFKSTSSTNGASLTQINNGIKVTVTVAGANKYIALKLDNPDNLLGKTLTISGNIAKSGSNDALIRFYFTNGNTLVSNIANTIYQTGKSTFTVPASYPTNCNGISIVFSATASNSGSVGNYVDYTNVQLEVGSTQTSYEPYVGGTASPNPDYPQAINNVTGRQTIDVVGKNFCPTNFDEWESGQYNTTGIKTDSTSRIRIKRLIPVSSSTTYYVNTFSGNDNFIFREYDKNGTFINSIGGKVNGSTFTTNSNTHYISITIYSNTNQTRDYSTYQTMFENGDIKPFICLNSETVKTYEPYIGQSYEINLGKNLFDKDNANVLNAYFNLQQGIVSNNDTRSIYIKCKPNTTYTIQKSGSVRFRIGTTSSVPNIGTSILNINSDDTASVLTITTPSNAQYLIAYIYGGFDTNPKTFDEVLETVQIEQGSTASSYSSYFTPIELNKISEKDYIAKSTGKNLFDKDNLNELTSTNIDSSGTITTTSGCRTIYIPIKSNTTYTISKIPSTRFRVATYTDTPQVGSTTSNYTANITTGNTTITSVANDKYLAVWLYYVSTDTLTYQQIIDTVQIEEGSTATDPEPYGVGKWYICNKIGKYIFDGSTNAFGYSSSNSVFVTDTLSTLIKKNTTMIANYYNQVDNTTTYANMTTGQMKLDGTNSGRIIIKDTRYTSANDYKIWLQSNNLILYYVLSTPTYTEITDTELISQLESIRLLKGINNIAISSGDLTGTYKIEYWNDNSEIIEDYTDLEDKRDTQPISCVRLGMSNIDGENVDLIDDDLVAKYGENWLILNDNPFAYNQSKREQLITAIFNKVKGFGYSSFVSKTSFKPYLTCGDTVKFKNKNGDLVDSILLRYSHEYKENDMQIQLEAPSETSATVNYIYPLSAIDLNKKTQIEVDKENVKITSLTEQTIAMQNNLNNNYYTIEQANQLIQESSTGLTNTFSEAGGNNIFRNTGLWFEQSDQNNPYEFWYGIVLKKSNDKASNNSALLLQNNTLYQQEEVPNGNYTVSFKYKKLIQLASVKCVINDTEYTLSETTDTEFMQTIEVNNQHIKVQFVSDTDNACEVYDLMVNAGAVKLAYSQNQNETTTDTVNISKGITITSSDNENIVFKANYDGVRIYEKSNMTTPKTKFTDKGTETNYLEVKDEAVVVDILIQRVGSQTWLTKI